ncbi:MAG TPA: Holliday junction branch migration protein RuvA [Clostridia bacterium]|nr:Holliday junction branch migration protein RuvA [Clostridia bacterium]
MYAHIKGMVEEIGGDRAVLEAGGVGYELMCSQATLRNLHTGREHRLYVHLHLSLAQDVMALYGFETKEERAMFRRLIAVTRIGPKLALAVLSQLSVSDIAAAILTENAAAFDRVPGMGRKTAARVLLELKEKVSPEDMANTPMAAAAAGGASMNMRSEAIAALVSLGYDGVAAGRAVSAVPDCARVEDMITQALRELASKGR